MRYTIEVPDQNADRFWVAVQELGITIQAEDTEYVVPQWQKDEVMRRRANAKPEDYIDWEELKKKYSAYGI